MSSAILTRDQLKSFLQNHEQVKAFEQLFYDVFAFLPESDAELAAQLGATRKPNNTAVLAMIAALEAYADRRPNLSQIEQRLISLEAQQQQRENLTKINDRLTTIEVLLGI